MTNGIKTVKYKRMIFFRCGCAARICELISDILGYCLYTASTDDISGDTDYILYRSEKIPELTDDVIVCAAVLIAAGIPIASITGYFKK